MQGATRLVQFGAPKSGRPSPSTRGGRVCMSPECDTILSIYNTLEWCSVHEQPAPRPGTGPLSRR
jgi:hypothetical protein